MKLIGRRVKRNTWSSWRGTHARGSSIEGLNASKLVFDNSASSSLDNNSCVTPNSFQRTTPIRLTHSPSRCSVIPVAGIKLGIGRRLCVASDAEQRTEGVERVEAPVEPKREFVEVGL